jgi:hypothetical protein
MVVQNEMITFHRDRKMGMRIDEIKQRRRAVFT